MRGGNFIYSNTKRLWAIAFILLFFVSSSSFSFPELAQSEAVLLTNTDVDQAVIEEASEVVNPDVAEIDNMVSVTDILESGDDVEEDSNEKEDVVLEEPEKTFSSDDWRLILVNKQHPIPDDYQFSLGTISGEMKCDDRIINPLFDMLRAARADGIILIVGSPYRNIDRQTMLFSNKVNRYMEGGMSYMEAYNLASQAVTIPGSSEHQIGLAVDIITVGYSTLDEGFGETEAGKWLQKNSSKFGFILRYPKGKEKLTGIEYEPWHFRYVGVDAAAVITENHLCLEEFWKMYVE